METLKQFINDYTQISDYSQENVSVVVEYMIVVFEE